MSLKVTISAELSDTPGEPPKVRIVWNQTPPPNNQPPAVLACVAAAVSGETANRIGAGGFPVFETHIGS